MTHEIERATKRLYEFCTEHTNHGTLRCWYVDDIRLVCHALERANDEIAKLKTLPCDSNEANEWLNNHAPIHVLESLWAWRRIADAAIAGRTVSCVCGEAKPKP